MLHGPQVLIYCAFSSITNTYDILNPEILALTLSHYVLEEIALLF